MTLEDLKKTMDPSKYIGLAPVQTKEFIEEVVNPVLDKYSQELGMTAEINV